MHRGFALALAGLVILGALGPSRFGGGASAQQPEPIQAPEPIAELGRITEDRLRNLTYPSGFTASGEAPLFDGVYREPAAPGSAADVAVTFARAAFGALNGEEAAAVILHTNAGGSGTFFDLFIVSFSDAGVLGPSAPQPLGDRIRLQDLRLADNGVRVDFTGFAPTDAFCCPTLNVAQHYAFDSEALTLIRATQLPAQVAVSAGPSLVGWFGGPTTSAAVLASTPLLDRIWWFDPDAEAWLLDARELPPALRTAIPIDRGTGLFIVARAPLQLSMPLAPPPPGCPLNPGPVDPVDRSLIVNTPGNGARLAGVVPVAGSARFFEANVRIRVLSAAGDVLADSFTTASAGAPEFAPFSDEIPVTVAIETAACVQIFEESARDGSQVNVAQVGVTLLPDAVAIASVARNAVDDAAVAPTTEAVAQFAVDLYRLVGAETGNLVFSPYSAAIALSMVRVGAEGETATEIDAVLHADIAGDLDAGFNALDQALARRSGTKARADGSNASVVLDTANALWGQREFGFRDPFLETLAADYGAGVRLVDFIGDPDGARQAINRWVAQRTRERIPTLIPEGLVDEMTRFALTNAIYLKAPWELPFEEDGTTGGSFQLLGGGSVDVPLMTLEGDLAYAAGADYQAVRLPYAGQELAMLVVVPDAGTFATFEAGLDGAFFRAATEQLQASRVRLRFPRFQFRTQALLADALQTLGMPLAFSDTADFSGITEDVNLRIQAVVHEAFIAVDEEGTEAAAATAVIGGIVSLPPEPIELIVDRPFLFAIQDVESGAILFFGRVVDPTAN